MALNTFTVREFADLIQHAHHRGPPVASADMILLWGVKIIGMDIQVKQVFETDPTIFHITSYDAGGEQRWRATAKFVRANNVPAASLFGRAIDDPMIVVIFGAHWFATDHPELTEGSEDLFTNDLLMLRMSRELWTPPPF